ncbi:MAG TPA: DUF6596 domain-containing protein, partial [Streptosporangiaceae bacterium]
YLIFNEGYSGRVDLSAEAIRLTRQLALACDEPEVAGLLALMLHHARRAARTDEHGALIPLDKQDRTRWNQAEITEGVRILQAALARDRRGEYQIQAAVAALHDDARTAEELATRLGGHHRLDAVRARLHEQAGHLDIAAEHYTRAAARARSTAERDYLAKQAARLRRG